MQYTAASFVDGHQKILFCGTQPLSRGHGARGLVVFSPIVQTELLPDAAGRPLSERMWGVRSLPSPVWPWDPGDGVGAVKLRPVSFQGRAFLKFRFDGGARLYKDLHELRELLFILAPSSASLSSHSLPRSFLILFTAPSENSVAAPPFICAKIFHQNWLACYHASTSRSARNPCSSGMDP